MYNIGPVSYELGVITIPLRRTVFTEVSLTYLRGVFRLFTRRNGSHIGRMYTLGLLMGVLESV